MGRCPNLPKCDICGKEFDSKEKLKEHAKKKHPGKAKKM